MVLYKPQFISNNYKEGRKVITSIEDELLSCNGYIFMKDEIYRIIVGSSNMTLNALTTNYEWNTKIASTAHGEYTHSIVSEFKKLWDSDKTLKFDQFIESYTSEYTKKKIIQRQKEISKKAEIPSLEAYRLKTNSMQVGFINNLRKIYESGENIAN